MRAPRRKTWTALVIALAVILFGAAADNVPPGTVVHHRGPPANAPLAIVSLGDSTISGEGAGSYEPGTDGAGGDWCHRSRVAEIHQTHVPGVATAVNLACSGASVAEVGIGTAVHYTERSQAAQLSELALRDRVTAIVVAVGANDDPHFSDVVNSCVQAWADKGSCSTGLHPSWQQRVASMTPKVTRVLLQIRAVMAADGYQPGSYQLVLQSYAAPIGPDVASGLLSLAGCPFRPADLQWVRTTAVTVLDNGLHRAADDAGARFLDLAGADAGHEACSGGRSAANEWFTRLTIAWQDINNQQRAGHVLQASFHPNARGYAAFGGCLGQFLATRDRAAACLAGRDGVLHPAAMTISPG